MPGGQARLIASLSRWSGAGRRLFERIVSCRYRV
jgi:hypothetical protein